MKKWMTMILSFMMAFLLVACSGTEEEVRGERTESEATEEKEFSMGETDGLVYENKFIGIGCTLESDWYFYTDEEIMALNNYTAGVAGEEYAEIMEGSELIYDMYAMNDNQYDNINVNLEKMNRSELDSLVIADAFKESIPILRDTYENMGYTDWTGEVSTVNIEDKEYTCIYSTGKIQGLEMYQKTFSMKCSGYLASVTITTYGEDKVDSLAERFYFVE